jgi:hypothetical protein
MSVLDLQKMQTPKEKGPPAGSRSSKGCNSGGDAGSQLSLLLC